MRHRFLAEIDALGGDARGAHHFQEFAAAAADIEHVAAGAEVGQIELLARLDVFLGAAEALREAAVVEPQRRGGAGLFARGRRGADAPLIAARCRMVFSSE